MFRINFIVKLFVNRKRILGAKRTMFKRDYQDRLYESPRESYFIEYNDCSFEFFDFVDGYGFEQSVDKEKKFCYT